MLNLRALAVKLRNELKLYVQQIQNLFILNEDPQFLIQTRWVREKLIIINKFNFIILPGKCPWQLRIWTFGMAQAVLNQFQLKIVCTLGFFFLDLFLDSLRNIPQLESKSQNGLFLKKSQF